MMNINIITLIVLSIVTIVVIIVSIKRTKCTKCGANKKATYAPNYKNRSLEYAGHYCPVCDKELIKEIELGL